MSALTVRRKIQLGIFALVIAILGVSFITTGAALSRSEGDGARVLRDATSQFDHYRRTSAEAMFAAVSVATDDYDLETLVQKNDAAGFAKAFERRSEDADKALDLDMIVVLTASGQLLAHRDVSAGVAGSVKETRSFRDSLSAISVADAIEYIGGEPYQIAAEPFYAPGAERSSKTTTGVMVIGRKLSTLLQRHVAKTGSDDLLLAIVKDGRILASEMPPAQWSLFESALAARQGGAVGTTVVNGVLHEVSIRDIDSCGGACTRVAQIAVFRSRGPLDAEKRKRLVETFLYLLATAAAAMFSGWLISWWITKPIERYVDATGAIAQGGGDLTKRLDASTDDELGRLGQNLNQVFAQIERLAAAVKARAHEVGQSSEEIRGASHALLDGAAEQATRLQSTGAATTEMSASIQQVATSAADANDIAKRSGAAIEDAVARMTQIRDAVEKAAHRMALLGDTGKRIGTIVDTIHQIADQTSLLALNAAIEAAHAGEHGRGFTVVADAVGQLATRVDRSAKEIDELIGQSRAQTDEALQAMGAGKREVELGTKLIADSIVGIKQVLAVFADTTAAVKEQAIASDEIARNMEAVGRIAQEVLVTSRQAVAQGDRLTNIASSLEEAVAGFKVDAEPPPPSSKALSKTGKNDQRLLGP